MPGYGIEFKRKYTVADKDTVWQVGGLPGNKGIDIVDAIGFRRDSCKPKGIGDDAVFVERTGICPGCNFFTPEIGKGVLPLLGVPPCS